MMKQVNSFCLKASQLEKFHLYDRIIPAQCLFIIFFGDFDWSVGKIKRFLNLDKNPCI